MYILKKRRKTAGVMVVLLREKCTALKLTITKLVLNIKRATKRRKYERLARSRMHTPQQPALDNSGTVARTAQRSTRCSAQPVAKLLSMLFRLVTSRVVVVVVATLESPQSSSSETETPTTKTTTTTTTTKACTRTFECSFRVVAQIRRGPRPTQPTKRARAMLM